MMYQEKELLWFSLIGWAVFYVVVGSFILWIILRCIRVNAKMKKEEKENQLKRLNAKKRRRVGRRLAF